MRRTFVILALGLCAATTAHADEATAKQQYEQGARAYNLGQFPKAIEQFTAAYEQWPEPAFLFNIAQAYRQAGDCKQALFFYKRFLALKENDTKKPVTAEVKREVEGRIVELDECVKRDIASKPPDALDSSPATSPSTPPTTPTTTATPAKTPPAKQPVATGENSGGGDDDDQEDKPKQAPTAGWHPSLISARVTGGISKVNAGNVATPVQASAAITAGYPLAIGDALTLELGAAGTFAPVSYGTTSAGDGMATFIGLTANVGASYQLIPAVAVRVDAGAGVLLLGGLEKEGNPFTMSGSAATGTLSALLARAALSADYAITNNFIVTATPLAFSYSPAPTGLLSSISSLTTLSFMVGVGYRM